IFHHTTSSAHRKPDLQDHFQRQTTRLLDHQTHVQDAWDQEYNQAHPEQFMSDDEMAREIDEAVYEPKPDQFFTAPGGSSSRGGQ
ncbi:hypothetical protein A2U01_0042869, partial [Trifolium medium]|nr:hypothetical protein [Trifolium medium]